MNQATRQHKVITKCTKADMRSKNLGRQKGKSKTANRANAMLKPQTNRKSTRVIRDRRKVAIYASNLQWRLQQGEWLGAQYKEQYRLNSNDPYTHQGWYCYPANQLRKELKSSCNAIAQAPKQKMYGLSAQRHATDNKRHIIHARPIQANSNSASRVLLKSVAPYSL